MPWCVNKSTVHPIAAESTGLRQHREASKGIQAGGAAPKHGCAKILVKVILLNSCFCLPARFKKWQASFPDEFQTPAILKIVATQHFW